jgi:hypothetical protein
MFKEKGLAAASLTRRHIMTVLAAAAGNLSFMSSASARHHHHHHHPYTKAWDPPSTQCFLKGTRIATPEGHIRVEEMAVGDLVVTDKGAALPIKWIGRRHFKKETASSWQEAVQPVRVSRFALDEETPYADLYLSPSHGLFIDGVLIPVMHLVNGVSIARAMPEGIPEIEYFHIELETHEVIFAEGAAVESLLVMEDRETFENFVEYERAYGLNGRPMTPRAHRACYDGGRSELRALLRRAVSQVIDVRDPIQIAHDRIARHAELVG